MARILIVDDEDAQRKILARVLSSEGHEVAEAGNVDQALAALASHTPEVVLTDLRMPGMGGIDLLEKIILRPDAPEVILATAHASVDTAVRAMRLGAYDYLVKPLEREELLLLVDRAREKYQLRKEAGHLRAELDRRVSEGLIAASRAMQSVLDLIDRVAGADATVLIRGESGTGKERMARRLHMKSPRHRNPFLAVNCAAFPESLLESELFGYEKGAFTGAQARKIGLIESVQGGTFFLDEIGDMPMATQVKLLRVIQEREIRRVGGQGQVKVDFRLIAATHRDLEAEVKAGRFREDLFYRLNVIPCVIPPLRDRREDIEPLIRFFLGKGSKAKGIDGDALDLLIHYPWPGNVRELEAVIERVVLLSPGSIITRHDLPPEIIHPRHGEVTPDRSSITTAGFILPPQGIIFEEWERQMLQQALNRQGGNMADAARLLGMTYRTFQYRAEKFGLRPSESE